MNDLNAGIALLQTLIQYESRHQDFDRVVALSKEYYDIFTGTGIAGYLKKYRANEDDAQFKQMLVIYETVIPGVVDNLDTIFEKPLRSNRVYSTIDIKDQSARAELLDRMQRFYQGQTDSGVDAFLQERWKHDTIYDPNAFIAIEFNVFNPVKEKPMPFAIEYPTNEVFNFNYNNGTLDWLVIEQKISYKRITGEKEEWVEGSKFIMYLENDAIVYTEVDKDQKLTNVENPTFVEIKDKDNKAVVRVFVQETFETKSGQVPAFRVGYKMDPVTRKRTCISSIHHALPFFKKELKSGAELDLTIRGHVFPQKYMYGPKCVGDKDSGKICKNGRTAEGSICAVCKGSGLLPIHTTAQEVVIVPLPTKGEEPILNLQQAMAYFSPDIALVKFMEEYCTRLTEKAKNAVFPSENLIGEVTVAKTATELDYSWDTRYDALRKFCAKYSWAWVFINRQNGIYLDIPVDTILLYHKFPSDFKMKGASVLLNEGKSAEDGNFPQHVKAAIHEDIANLYYADDQDTLTKIKIKNKFMPFVGKTPAELQSILVSADVIPYYKTLYVYFDIIFNGIDEEMGDLFYAMPYEKQKTEVEKRVGVITAEIDKQKAITFKEAQEQITEPVPGEE